MKPTLLSLFSGIGGIDLAFERAGFQVKGQVEIDDYCNAILAKHWPGVPRWRDVRTFGCADFPGSVDVIAGGFPCQDISAAGKGAGIKEGTRSGLWFEFARVIGELRPRYVFIENVPAITTNGGTTVLSSLASLGYSARWQPVSASDVGAPHGRKRWFCVAYAAASSEAKQSQIAGSQSPMVGPEFGTGSGIIGGYSATGISLNGRTTAGRIEDVGYSASIGRAEGRAELTLRQRLPPSASSDIGVSLSDADGEPMGRSTVSRAERGNGSVESRLGGIFDGLPARLDTARRQTRWPAPPGQPQHEWEAPRTSQGEAHRTARLKALGNSVVPQVIQPFAEGLRQALEADYLGEQR